MTTWPTIDLSGNIRPTYRQPLEQIVRWAIDQTPDAATACLEVHVRLRNVIGGGVSGVMYHEPHHANSMTRARPEATHLVTLSLQHHRGAPDITPGVEIPLYTRRRGTPPVHAANWAEYLVFVAAHEAWHVHQSIRAARPGHTGPKFSEVEADQWGTTILDLYRATTPTPGRITP